MYYNVFWNLDANTWTHAMFCIYRDRRLSDFFPPDICPRLALFGDTVYVLLWTLHCLEHMLVTGKGRNELNCRGVVAKKLQKMSRSRSGGPQKCIFCTLSSRREYRWVHLDRAVPSLFWQVNCTELYCTALYCIHTQRPSL